jgi:A/G-specific adenine glycosylase
MLQQIQVKRAVPFYERFLERFPTVNALTEAPLAVAIRVWEDLERYRRVVYLYKTARRLVREHGGGLRTVYRGRDGCFANMRRVLHGSSSG